MSQRILKLCVASLLNILCFPEIQGLSWSKVDLSDSLAIEGELAELGQDMVEPGGLADVALLGGRAGGGAAKGFRRKVLWQQCPPLST